MTKETIGPDLKIFGELNDCRLADNCEKCLCLLLTYRVFFKLETELKLEGGSRKMPENTSYAATLVAREDFGPRGMKPCLLHEMSVNLCAQEGEEPRDVVLHFDVRFHRDNIISLSRKNGVWIGSGNLDTNYNMFVPGTIFRIMFEVKDTDVITIYCQGKFHSNFLPKIPLSMARYLVAWADVEKVTHCYFHVGAKSGDEIGGGGFVGPPSPRPGAIPIIAGDGKRCLRPRKKSPPGSPELRSSNESSDDEVEQRPNTEGRADKYFYDALMCQHPDAKYESPDTLKYRRNSSLARLKPEHSKQYRDTKKNDTVSEEVAANNMDSSVTESDEAVEMGFKKRGRRKFAPFSQVVNFMGKAGKRS